MTREVKFRGQRTDTKEWVYGYYAHTTLSDDGLCLGDCMKHHLIIDSGVYYEVIPETVGQYTEFEDKNGREVFEGDILSCNDIFPSRGIQNFVVEYYSGSYHATPIDKIKKSYLLLNNITDNSLLIGNRYDNEDLINI